MRFYVLVIFCISLGFGISQAAEPAKIGQPLLCHGCVAVLK
ncbi:hypothetical protein TNCT_710551, partial [Trichonephila clavata]